MPSAYVDVALRRLVVRRAGERCEYCTLAQQGQEATFHVDHVVPVKHGGKTTADNLALACVSCSLRKAARLDAVDPATGVTAEIFNPRRDAWAAHFRWDEVMVIGTTSIGRATVAALAMNRELILAIRRQERQHGRHPPPDG